MAGGISATVVLILRAIQVVFALITLGLTAYVANWWGGAWHVVSPSSVNFLVFCSVWSLLALAYLILVPWRFSNTVAHHKFAILAVEGVTMIFWFAGFIALAAFLTGRMCWGAVCEAAKAGTAFAAFEWAFFAATFTLSVLHVLSTRRSTDTEKADPNLNVQEGV